MPPRPRPPPTIPILAAALPMTPFPPLTPTENPFELSFPPASLESPLPPVSHYRISLTIPSLPPITNRSAVIYLDDFARIKRPFEHFRLAIGIPNSFKGDGFVIELEVKRKTEVKRGKGWAKVDFEGGDKVNFVTIYRPGHEKGDGKAGTEREGKVERPVSDVFLAMGSSNATAQPNRPSTILEEAPNPRSKATPSPRIGPASPRLGSPSSASTDTPDPDPIPSWLQLLFSTSRNTPTSLVEILMRDPYPWTKPTAFIRSYEDDIETDHWVLRIVYSEDVVAEFGIRMKEREVGSGRWVGGRVDLEGMRKEGTREGKRGEGMGCWVRVEVRIRGAPRPERRLVELGLRGTVGSTPPPRRK